MSDADRDHITVEADGITVQKTPDTEQFETLAIVFEIHSDHDQPAWVRIVDRLPDTISLEDVGFHPDYGGDHWAAETNRVVFERELAANEAYTTIYGIRAYEDDDIPLFLDEPRLEIIDPRADTLSQEDFDAAADPARSRHVREVVAGERETLPGLEATATATPTPTAPAGPTPGPGAEPEPASATADPSFSDAADAVESLAEAVGAAESIMDATQPDAEGPDQDVEPISDVTAEPAHPSEPEPAPEPEPEPVADVDLGAGEEPMIDVDLGPDDEPMADVDLGADDEPVPDVDLDSGEDDAHPEEPEEITVPLTGGVARVLVKELQAGKISDDDRRLLREELFDTDWTIDARIRDLQTEVSDLRAYTGALEAFIDEHGSAKHVVERLEHRIDDVYDRIEDVHDTHDTIEDDLAAVRTDRLDPLAASIKDLEHDVTALQDDHARLDTLTGTVEEIERTVESLAEAHERVESLERTTTNLEHTLDTLQDRTETVPAIEEALRDLEEAVEQLQQDQVRTENLERTLEDLEHDLGSLREDRARFDAIETQLDETTTAINRLDARLEDIAGFRERLEAAFGGHMTDE